MIERQVIVTWYDPADKLPEEDMIVIATVSGSAAGLKFERTPLPICYGGSKGGWYSLYIQLDDVTVHGWCDLEPYKGGK